MANKNKIIKISALCLGLALIVSITVGTILTSSMAKFTERNTGNYTAELEDFDVDFYLTYTDANNQNQTITPSSLSNSAGVIRLTENEYNTLKMYTSYTGEGRCYYRFKITESWQHTETIDNEQVDIITPKTLSTYSLDNTLYDNRSDDGFIYCKDILSGESRNFTAITQFTAGTDADNLIDSSHHSQFVDISIELEAVQWNRAEEIWKLSKLPWVS